jgi:hypothetical protein
VGVGKWQAKQAKEIGKITNITVVLGQLFVPINYDVKDEIKNISR